MPAVITHGDGRHESVRLPQGTIWAGAGEECLLRLSGRGVGARHARLDIGSEGHFGIVDLGCTAGTRVNGERVVTAGPLGAEDVVRIGDSTIRILPDPSPPQVTPVTAAQADAAAAPRAVAGPHGDAFLAVARRVHQRLIEQLDLRRRDVASMSDGDLRGLAAALLAPAIAAEALPPGVEAASLLRFVIDEALGLGPLEALLADDEVSEVMVNGPETIFVERRGTTERAPGRFSGEHALRGIVERIVTPVGRRIDDASPMVDARLPDGSRVHIVIPPIALRGTAITIRRFGRRRPAARDLVASGSLDERMLEFLRICVVQRRNLVVCGGTGSGKTTLLNVLSSLIPRGERVVTIEDSAELAFDHPNLVALETRNRNIEGRGEVTVRDLVRNALRMRPDRIVVGECRGGETLDMLQAMNTGHDGSLTTVHANSPRELLSRLEVMVLMSGVDLPVVAVREQIASSIHVIVQQARFACGARRITHVTEVTGVTAGTVQLQDLFRFIPEPPDASGRSRGRHVGCGHVPQFYERLSRAGQRLDLAPFADDAAARVGSRA
ncbi:MAG: Flp pilus assembly complex ATPase component TadA [Steroidobacteraceae bacterium]|jgi:pilus assembly protein CpaF|nr:Flp pilus assembly complex ATPase component TadA [Steroidobacteraceae bacterium]